MPSRFLRTVGDFVARKGRVTRREATPSSRACLAEGKRGTARNHAGKNAPAASPFRLTGSPYFFVNDPVSPSRLPRANPRREVFARRLRGALAFSRRNAAGASLEITVRPILLAVNESLTRRRRLFAVFARRDCSAKAARTGRRTGCGSTTRTTAAVRGRGRGNQLIWQIIASRCKQGGSICLLARKRGRWSGEGRPRVSEELGCREGRYQRGRRGISIPGEATDSASRFLSLRNSRTLLRS